MLAAHSAMGGLSVMYSIVYGGISIGMGSLLSNLAGEGKEYVIKNFIKVVYFTMTIITII